MLVALHAGKLRSQRLCQSRKLSVYLLAEVLLLCCVLALFCPVAQAMPLSRAS